MRQKFFISLTFNLLLLFGGISLLFSFREKIAQKIIDTKGSVDTIMLGDSHTEFGNWSFLLRQPVKRAGSACFTSWQVQRFWLSPAMRLHPKYCFILAGTNDISLNPSYNLPELMAANKAMADTIRAHHSIPIFQTIPYRCQDSTFNRQVDSANVRLKQYCSLEHIDLIDLSRVTAKNNELNSEYARADKVHLNEKGYEVWANELTAYLDKHQH